MYEHKNKLIKGFSSKYNLNKLIYFEQGNDAYEAIAREKQIKGGSRAKKIALVNTNNPKWHDLSKDWEWIDCGVYPESFEGYARNGKKKELSLRGTGIPRRLGTGSAISTSEHQIASSLLFLAMTEKIRNGIQN